MTAWSFIEPPGWMTAVAPASTAASMPSGKEEGVGGDDRAFGERALDAGGFGGVMDLRWATREESTRLIWPAPMPVHRP